jgi:hypothetical protein
MVRIITAQEVATKDDMERMHEVYRQGGEKHQMAPHVVYGDNTCPHGCGRRMQAIDFRLEAYGPTVHDPLVRAWWNDHGFAGRCPQCGSWIHFTIRGKRAISATEANQLPQLPDDWHQKAIIL